MNPKFLYLSLDLLTILFPFLFSFYSKANFSKQWKHLWVAILIPGIAFILWDEAFTRLGVWGFNPYYLSGVFVGSLPVEELLFFICIPYACVFTYDAFSYLIKRDYLDHLQKAISIALIIISMLVGSLNVDKWYTCTTFFGLAVYLFLLRFVWKVSYLGRFYFSWCIILVPLFIVNGILTGSWIDNPVVWYNDAENLGIRIGTIPLEDLFYGMFLVMINVSIFEFIRGRTASLNKEMIPRST